MRTMPERRHSVRGSEVRFRARCLLRKPTHCGLLRRRPSIRDMNCLTTSSSPSSTRLMCVSAVRIRGPFEDIRRCATTSCEPNSDQLRPSRLAQPSSTPKL